MEGKKLLIHITPRIISPHWHCKPKLVELKIKELGLTLVGEKNIVTRQPYPNKQYFVASSKKSRKAVSGILVEFPHFLQEYTVVSQWDCDCGNESLVTHIVKYVVLDSDFDFVSDDILLWDERMPEWAKGIAPLHIMPCMDVSPMRERQGVYQDVHCSITNLIIKRTEIFQLPTIERECILNDDFYPLPRIESVFKVGMPQ